jgi:hypothetical protein
MMTSSSVYVLFIDDGGYLAPVAKAPYDGGQRNQASFPKALQPRHPTKMEPMKREYSSIFNSAII